eukprot:GEMP01020649.1.p1 GENE.GEMP01020649.1~~GEMP01020649.1.p1  ORF type:complete len:664 (+),score=199.42 GEMP01020649.1:295-2286(+)
MVLVVFLLSISTVLADNPVRKVVTLLQNLGHEVENEGEKEKQLFDKFMCYCKTNKETSSQEIEEAETRLGNLESTIKELAGSNNQLTSEIEELSKELAEDQKSVEEASRVRKQEAAQYQQEAMDAKTSIASLDKAIPEIRRGLEAQPSFLQKSPLLQKLRPIFVQYQSIVTGAGAPMQEDLFGMIQSGTAGSGEIIGILEQMRDGFKENLAKATKEEEEALATYNNLMMGKAREINAATTEIDEKKERRASQMQLRADAQEDNDDTSESLATTQSFLRNLNKSCAEKSKEFEDGERARAQELLAIQDTIKILNDDDALDTFKKTLPSPEPPSFMQVEKTDSGMSLLMEETKTIMHRDKFWKLKKMVNTMISDIMQAQKVDETKLKWCKAEITLSEDEQANVKDHVVHHEQEFEAGDQERKDVSEIIAMLNIEVQAIDKEIADATAQRKAETSLFTETLSQLQIASQLLRKARDRLAKQYQPPALIQQDDAATMLGLNFLQENRQPGREGKAGGILSMIDELRHDLELDEQQLQLAERTSQKDFEKTILASQNSREAKKKDIVNKRATSGRVKEQMSVSRQKLKESGEEKMAIDSKLLALHKTCDFLIGSFDQRKRSRANELDGLQKNLAILSGADYDVAKPTPEPAEVLEKASQFLQIRHHIN